jgi:hypothetical protein
MTKHLRNVLTRDELERESVRAKFAHTAADNKNYRVKHGNMNEINYVENRDRSLQGTCFPQKAESDPIAKQLMIRLIENMLAPRQRREH